MATQNTVNNVGGGGGGLVDSVFSRIGDVVAQSGDYVASDITNTPAGTIASTNVQSALNELDTEKQASSTALTSLAAITDPGEDAMIYWNDTTNAYETLQVGTNLAITAGVLDATGGGGGTGDVVGPASSTDNALARFDTTTGKLIQNSTITVDDGGNVTMPAATTLNIGNGGIISLQGGTSAPELRLASETGGNSLRISHTGAGGAVIENLSIGFGESIGTFSRSLTISGNSTLSGTNTGNQTITLTGDVTGTGTGSFAATIASDAVTYAKMQNVLANGVLGRAAATDGDAAPIVLSASQLFGRGSTGDLAPITIGANLSMTGTTLSASGGGGGVVDSVNGQTGIVVLDTDDITEGLTNLYYTDERAQDAIGTILTDTSEIDFTYNDAAPTISAALVAGSIDETKLDVSVNASLDLADSALQPNIAIVGATKTKVTYDADGLITAGADATTADIAPSTNRNYLTDAQAVVIGNTSGTNTGDQTNISGNAATVTTNANLTGPITSVGNATSIAAQTGTGTTFVVDTSPTLVTPTLGVATATTVNKVAITAPATAATITPTEGTTTTLSGGTHSGTNTGDQNLSTYVVGPASSIDTKIALFNGTTGKLIKQSTATIDGGGNAQFTSVRSSSLKLNDNTLANVLSISNIGEIRTADRILSLVVNDADRSINLGGNITLAGGFTTSGANALTLTTTAATNVTLPTTGTLITASSTNTLTAKSIDVDNNTVTNIETDNFKTGVIDTDVTLAANSDTKIATQKAVKAYADGLLAANDAMTYKGAIDASTNPNYPAGDAGDTYRISVAGKIGGVSGTNVEAGDMAVCIVDGSAAGDQATVGANWNILERNLDGAVIGPASAVDSNLVSFDSTTGKLVKDSGVATSSLISASSTTTFTNKTFDADGTGNSLTNVEDANIKTGAAIDASKIANGSVSNAEFQYLDGVTSAIQTQLNAKGVGDVVGPASATDNAIARFDATTGKLIQNSTVTIDDSGNISAPGSFTLGGGFDPTSVLSYSSATVATNTLSGFSGTINYNILPKGTGRLQVNGADVPTVSSSDTFINKTHTSAVLNTGISGTAIASSANITTGTSNTLIITPDGLAGSDTFGRKGVTMQVTSGAVAVGDGAAYFTIPVAMTGMNLVRAQATVATVGTTGSTTVMIHNLTDAANMLSGAISIASGSRVGTVGTINVATDDVATNDIIRIDVDSVSTTAPLVLMVQLEFQLP